MDFKQRKQSLIDLHHFLARFFDDGVQDDRESQKFKALDQLIKRARQNNPWFTEEFVLESMRSWKNALTEEKVEEWLSGYHFPDHPSKTIGIVSAGNIPLVGLHDLICGFMTGQQLLIKRSSKDRNLLPVFAQLLLKNDKEQQINFTEDRLQDFDAVIATGSNNTSRYFEYYFRSFPSLIRHNRNSVAVLSGEESTEQLEGLADDIMRYFGLGCRNVSKIYVPKGFDFDPLFKAVLKYQHLIDHHQYASNYEYNKAVYLMSDVQLLENGLLLLKEDKHLSSPIACLNYQYYDHKNDLEQELISQKNNIQCIVGDRSKFNLADVDFGETQDPELWNYADNINTLDFLDSIIKNNYHEETQL